MDRKVPQRVDRAIYLLFKCINDYNNAKNSEEFKNNRQKKVNSNHSSPNHKVAKNATAWRLTRTGTKTWIVDTDGSVYFITKSGKTDCGPNCVPNCGRCQSKFKEYICQHSFNCTCTYSSRHASICSHVHFLCLQTKQDAPSEEKQAEYAKQMNFLTSLNHDHAYGFIYPEPPQQIIPEANENAQVEVYIDNNIITDDDIREPRRKELNEYNTSNNVPLRSKRLMEQSIANKTPFQVPSGTSAGSDEEQNIQDNLDTCMFNFVRSLNEKNPINPIDMSKVSSKQLEIVKEKLYLNLPDWVSQSPTCERISKKKLECQEKKSSKRIKKSIKRLPLMSKENN